MDTLPMPDPDYLEPTIGRAAAIWWALLWRGILFGAGGGFVAGLIEGSLMGILGFSSGVIRNVALISGLVIGIPVGIYVVQVALRKKYRDFRIRLIPSARSSN
jgi:hypothetical protein